MGFKVKCLSGQIFPRSYAAQIENKHLTCCQMLVFSPRRVAPLKQSEKSDKSSQLRLALIKLGGLALNFHG